MNTYNQLIREYRGKFKEKGLSQEMVKAFLFELCNDFHVNLYLDIDQPMKEEIYDLFISGMERMMNHEPMNYVLGYSYFYGYRFKVNEGVLIPRPETEELVGLILNRYDAYFSGKEATLFDVGTGSGAIAIALKKEEPSLKIYASDISMDALKVAKENAEQNECQVGFLEGSMLDPFIEAGLKADILVSNPPYIKTGETIEDSVYDFEPHVALFGGEDGLKFYRELLEKAHLVLKENGLIFFEMGYDLRQSLSALVKQYFPSGEVEVYKDINGKDRMMMVKL